MFKLTHIMLGGVLLASAKLAGAGTVTEVFNGDMLGTNQSYFESIAGIPRESWGDDHIFRVQGCEITASIQNERVTGLRLVLSPDCRADLSSFIGSYAPASDSVLTFGAFEAASGGGLNYLADCLTMCGNAYDPSVYAHCLGPRTAEFLEVKLEAVQVDDQALAAASVWQDHMTEAMGEDWVVDARFNCDSRFNSVARLALAEVPVTAVSIGYQLEVPGC